ncbi:DUF1573 domain-containing protein [Pedobacter immunditicola]|uniref:DUF1573 domain-containing protein n=1 Tax=Pedobacter immunditicola TaxID=3133440 RepID=UPI003095A056
MNKIFMIALAGVIFTSCQQNTAQESNEAATTEIAASTATPSADAPVLTFEKGSHDFGKIKQGETIQYDFKFKNTGKTPLIITNATATCGCTVPEVPKDPILPGAEGSIKVVFDSTGKMGIQDKIITVTSNGNPAINEVHIVGEITQS